MIWSTVLGKRPTAEVRGRLAAAAERVLAEGGAPAVTTRAVASAAGVTPGLVHYHFGSIESLLATVADEVGARLVDRRRDAWGAVRPFAERFRSAVGTADDDVLVWAELQAAAWHRPAVRERVAAVEATLRGLMAAAFAAEARARGLSGAAVAPMVSLVTALDHGLAADRLLGLDEGHAELTHWLQGWLLALAEETSVGPG